MKIKFTNDDIEILQLALSRLRGDLEEELEKDNSHAEILSKIQKCDTLFEKLLDIEV